MICITAPAAQLAAIVMSEFLPMFQPFRRTVKSGGMGIRTPDIQLAKLALYQLSYTPLFSSYGPQGFSHGCGWGGRRKIE